MSDGDGNLSATPIRQRGPALPVETGSKPLGIEQGYETQPTGIDRVQLDPK